MHINVTTLIQIGNFACTYLFLRHILFKPIIQLLQKKAAARVYLAKILKEKELVLANLQDEKNKFLSNFRLHLKTAYQFPRQTPLEFSEEISYQPNKDVLIKLVDESAQLMVQKVPYVYR